MKLRNGFVSNSSSSSFVIAALKKDACPGCGISFDMILKLVEDTEGCWLSSPPFDDELEDLAEDVKANEEDIARGVREEGYEMRQYASDEEFIRVSEDCKQVALDRIKKIEGWLSDYDVYRVNVAHCDHTLPAMLELLERLGTIKVLEHLY